MRWHEHASDGALMPDFIQLNGKRRRIMKKKFNLEDLDCANCAAKMEAAIKEIPGVTNASVNFLAQKMMIEAPDDQFDSIVEKAVACIAKVEPDCRVIL